MTLLQDSREQKSQEATTQSDPIAMGLYAMGRTPLMTAVTSPSGLMLHSSSNMFYLVTCFIKSLLQMILLVVENENP